MGNSESESLNHTELKESSNDKLSDLDNLSTKQIAKILNPILDKVIRTNDMKIIERLQSPSFLQSILFKESGNLEPLVPFLRKLYASNALRCGLDTYPRPAEIDSDWLLMFTVIVFNVPIPGNIIKHLKTASGSLMLVFNTATNSNLPVDSSVNHINAIQLLTGLTSLKKSIKDNLSKLITEHLDVISAKFPIVIQPMSPLDLCIFTSCMPSLNDYMIVCIVDQFSVDIKSRFQSTNLRSDLLEIMNTAAFDQWVECFLICRTKNNVDGVKTKLRNCPYTLMVENIVYRLEQYADNLRHPVPEIKFKRNKWANYENEQTGFIIDHQTGQVVGKQLSDGNVALLTIEDIKICKNHKLVYKS